MRGCHCVPNFDFIFLSTATNFYCVCQRKGLMIPWYGFGLCTLRIEAGRKLDKLLKVLVGNIGCKWFSVFEKLVIVSDEFPVKVISLCCWVSRTHTHYVPQLTKDQKLLIVISDGQFIFDQFPEQKQNFGPKLVSPRGTAILLLDLWPVFIHKFVQNFETVDRKTVVRSKSLENENR
jgi:hypothetical protein